MADQNLESSERERITRLEGMMAEFAQTVETLSRAVGSVRTPAVSTTEPQVPKSLEELSYERLTEISRFTKETLELLASRPVFPAGPVPAITISLVRLKCGEPFTIVGEAEAEGESSFDFGCNDQATKDPEAKKDAEEKAKQKARDDASRQVQYVGCESGCKPIIDTEKMTDTITDSLSIGKRDTTLGCYWKWKAKAKAYLPGKCVPVA